MDEATVDEEIEKLSAAPPWAALLGMLHGLCDAQLGENMVRL